MSIITIHSKISDYFVSFCDAKERLENLCMSIPNRCFVIDSNVWEIYRDKLPALQKEKVFLFKASEDSKTFDSVFQIYDFLLDNSVKRNTTIVVVGGGTTQDIAGFAASTIFRGIEWILFPTSYLAQADSCIGGKTSINYQRYKNLVGTFAPPKEIWIDPEFNTTLPDTYYYSGLGEVAKLALLQGEEGVNQFQALLPDIRSRKKDAVLKSIQDSIRVKKDYIELDEFDKGKRQFLNYGHCFGHALETTSNYELPHGQAVLIGMALANIISRKRGLLSPNSEARIYADVLRPCLFSQIKQDHYEPENVVSAMAKDKKRTGAGLPLILLLDGYEMVKVDDLSPSEISEALVEYVERESHGSKRDFGKS